MPDALETALRELREPASPGFAAELDARVARGFDAPPRPRRTGPRFPRLRRLLLPAGGLAAACLVVLALVVAVRSLPDGEGTSASSSGGSSAGSSSAGPSSFRSAPASPATRPRRVERTAALTLAAPASKVEEAAAGVSGVADRFGGYVESSTVDATGTGGGGDFVLRLPVRRLDGAMAALARLGEVRSRRQTAEDVTATHDRARAALARARAERTALLRRLAAATTDAQTRSLRARLRDADAAIDRALTAVRRVDRRAAYARVDVTLVARRAGGAAPAAQDGAWGPGAAWRDARRVLAVAAGVAVVTAAVLLPLLLLGVLLLTARRLLAARARERLLDGV